MILLWVDINSSFAHSSLALPALHAQSAQERWLWHVVSGTLQTPYTHFIQEALRLQPEVITATAWLFTHNRLLEVLSRIKALLPHTYIIIGGPEFLGNNEPYLKTHPYVDAVFRGEGEEVFPLWLRYWNQPEKRNRLPGVCTLDAQAIYQDNGTAKVACFQALRPPECSPFFVLDKPFVQIETSRGCFNECYFCVSGGDKPVHLCLMEQIRERLKKLANKGILKIRILDRTFNAIPKRAIELLHLFKEFTGIFIFHIEIHPALLTPELKRVIASLPEGLIHVEAGVQSLDDRVLEVSGRIGNRADTLEGLRFLSSNPNFETHVDLIAGLPHYTLTHLIEDVKELMILRLDEIQLELLKLLPGTKMRKKAASLEITYAPTPPYEVLSTPAMPTEALNKAIQLSHLLDGWYNGKSDWREPFVLLVLQESHFLDAFLHELMKKQLLEQPLSMERRGLLLYEFCIKHYPSHLPEISVSWIRAGYSLKKGPGQQVIPCKNGSKDDMRFYRLPTPSGDYWFGFDRKEERRRPCVIQRHPPE